uniref:Uncharacterized protein n=1 Tax=Bos indicus x Bos taurus TaxID=30522 RepID=A0A4W2D147_BOBOX
VGSRWLSSGAPPLGPERGRGRADVPHHHADQGGSGEVQGSADNRAHRQRLRQH